MLDLGRSVTAGQHEDLRMEEPRMLPLPRVAQAERGQRAEAGAGNIHLMPFNKT